MCISCGGSISFMEQTEEWYDVPSTGKGKAMPQRGIVTEDN